MAEAQSSSAVETVSLYVFTLLDALDIVGLEESRVNQLRTKLHSLKLDSVLQHTYWHFERSLSTIGDKFDGFYDAVDVLRKLRQPDPDIDVPAVDITNAKDKTEIVDLLMSSLVEYSAGDPKRRMGWPVYLRCHLLELDVSRYRERYGSMPLEILREDVEESIEERVVKFCSGK
ncbi:hypothetical protein G6514_003035 [Epicoccum nigrum]|nr:hypothetical protein G6514_003035 [Epicoccum nigrum]